MEKLLIKVKDTFLLADRGLVITPLLPVPDKFKPFSKSVIVLKPDNQRKEYEGQFTSEHFYLEGGGGKSNVAIYFKSVSKNEIPIGSKIFVDSDLFSIFIKKMSVEDVEGKWEESYFDSGLIQRCKNAWKKPFLELTNEEMATFLRQKIAVDYILPLARQRVLEGVDDNSEMYEGELRKNIAEFDNIQ